MSYKQITNSLRDIITPDKSFYVLLDTCENNETGTLNESIDDVLTMFAGYKGYVNTSVNFDILTDILSIEAAVKHILILKYESEDITFNRVMLDDLIKDVRGNHINELHFSYINNAKWDIDIKNRIMKSLTAEIFDFAARILFPVGSTLGLMINGVSKFKSRPAIYKLGYENDNSIGPTTKLDRSYNNAKILFGVRTVPSFIRLAQNTPVIGKKYTVRETLRMLYIRINGANRFDRKIGKLLVDEGSNYESFIRLLILCSKKRINRFTNQISRRSTSHLERSIHIIKK